MPVTVSLLELVKIADTRPLWPEKFAALIARLEDKPNNRAAYGVIADWLQENDEHTFAEAFRWMHKHPKVTISKLSYQTYWSLSDMPDLLADQESPDTWDEQTIPGVIAGLAYRLEKAREQAKKQLEELS